MFVWIDASEFFSYAEDNTPFVSGQNHEKLITSLQTTLNSMTEWYQQNYFKVNADKCPFGNKEMAIANDNIKYKF